MGMGANNKETPSYAVFDDFVYSQRIGVLIRWFLLLTWLLLINYRTDLGLTSLWALNGMGLALSCLNGYVHWRIRQGRPITKRYVIALSVMDLSIITAGIAVTTRFHNTFFVFYYPALLGMSLVFSSRRLSFSVVTVVAGVYAAISLMASPGVDIEIREERTLIVRIATMFAVVAAANLMTRIERNRRRDAVEAERAEAQRNLELQRQAQNAELMAREEKSRIGREIHDGIAQSIYALSLNLEACAELAERESGQLRDRLKTLVPIAKNTLLETRYYIFDLKPLLADERNLEDMVENQIREFRSVSGLTVNFEMQGQPGEVSVASAAGIYRILQEILANILKHASATRVGVELTFESDQVLMAVQDDGVGFDIEDVRPGYGLENMRQRADELGGSLEVESAKGKGTEFSVKVPTG